MKRPGIAAPTISLTFLLLVAVAVEADSSALPGDDIEAPARIVTLAPHLAELVYAVGAGDALVGVSAYSNFPQAVTTLPQVGDAFLLDQEQLLLLQPDILLAWKSGTPARTVNNLRERGYRVEVIQTSSLDDVALALARIGELTGHEEQAQLLAERFTSDIEKLRIAHAHDQPIRVFYQIAPRPLYTANNAHYVSELIELCGGQNIFGDLGELAPLVSEEAVIVRDPEVMIAGGIGAEDNAFGEWQRWPTMAANTLGNHFYVPADLLGRPTPRLAEAATRICADLDTARLNRARVAENQEWLR